MITNGKILMEQAIWQKIIKHMYEPGDVEILSSNLRLLSSSKPAKTPKGSFNFATENRADSRKKSRDPKPKKRGRTNSFQSTQVISHKINFTEFLETILDFQLGEHEKFLGKFMNLFKQIDSDCDGIVTSQQFIQLYQSMNIDFQLDQSKFNKEIDNFLDILDPYQCEKITLSDIVQLFSSYKVDIMDFKKQTNLHIISEKVGSIEESHFNSKNFHVPDEASPTKDEEKINHDIMALEKELYAA